MTFECWEIHSFSRERKSALVFFCIRDFKNIDLLSQDRKKTYMKQQQRLYCLNLSDWEVRGKWKHQMVNLENTEEWTSDSGLSLDAEEQGKKKSAWLAVVTTKLLPGKMLVRSQLFSGSKPVSTLRKYTDSIVEHEASETSAFEPLTFRQPTQQPARFLSLFHMH